MSTHYSHVNDLAIRNNMIAMEAIALKPNIDAIRSKLSGVAGVMSEWIHSKIVPQTGMGLVIYANTLRGIQAARYTDVSQNTISIPRGAKVMMPEYVAALIPMVEFCEVLEQNLLKPFSVWVALRKAAPDSLKSATNIRELNGIKPLQIDQWRAKVDALIEPTSRIDKLPMGKVYPNISSLEECWRATNTLVTRYLATRPGSIVKLTDRIAQDISELVDQLEANGVANTIAPNTIAVLSTICYQMAAAVEFYGVVGTLLKELSVVASNNNAELKKPLADSAKVRSKEGMATESLVASKEIGVEAYGKWFSERTFRQLAEERKHTAELTAISDVDWVFEYTNPDCIDTTDRVYVVGEDALVVAEIEGTLYPVLGLGYLKAMKEAGAECLNIIKIDLKHAAI